MQAAVASNEDVGGERSAAIGRVRAGGHPVKHRGASHFWHRDVEVGEPSITQPPLCTVLRLCWSSVLRIIKSHGYSDPRTLGAVGPGRACCRRRRCSPRCGGGYNGTAGALRCRRARVCHRSVLSRSGSRTGVSSPVSSACFLARIVTVESMADHDHPQPHSLLVSRPGTCSRA